MEMIKINNKKLKGAVKVPPSKSDAHRAVICASLCRGRSVIRNIDMSKDITATVEAMRKLGADINIIETKPYKTLEIVGLKNNPIEDTIDCCESGSTLRFLIPLMLLLNNGGVITGEGKLVERPLDVYYDIFKEKGISFKTAQGKLPLRVEGKIESGVFEVRGDVSSQFITGLLFVLPVLEGDSTLKITTELESKGYVDLTIKVMEQFGIQIENNNYKEFLIKGNQEYKAKDYSVEGDFSQSAFWMVAGVLGEEIKVESLNQESVQGDKVIIEILRRMEADINSKESVVCKESSTKGITIDVKECPDLAPVLTVMGALSEGTTYIVNGERLRIKESDRLTSITTELKKLGADIIEKRDSLEIHGVKELVGGTVDSWNDHRIAMALAVASIRCKGELKLTGFKSVQKSYPRFWEDFASLGGEIYE